MIFSRIRKWLAEMAMFFFLLTVSPAVYAMAEAESRQIRRTAIVQMVTIRERRRALDRRYGPNHSGASYFMLSLP